MTDSQVERLNHETPEKAGNAAAQHDATLASTDSMTTLPLGWTRVQRKRPRVDGDQSINNDNSNGVSINAHCDDPACQRLAAQWAEDARLFNTARHEKYTGKAIFLLLENNPQWMQGYFFPDGTRRSWGLLAEQQAVDDCLQCSEGGYRVLSIKVYRYKASESESTISMNNIEWTGGDMMRLNSPSVTMQATECYTGDQAAQLAEQIFASVLHKLNAKVDLSDSGNTSTLDLIPDIAVVKGSMELRIEIDNSGDDDKVKVNDSQTIKKMK
jgi:hypothetical protein